MTRLPHKSSKKKDRVGRAGSSPEARLRWDQKASRQKIKDLTEELQRSRDSLQQRDRELIESRSELHALAARLMATQEEERRRVSRELHDDLNQRLAILEVDAERMGQQVPSSSGVVEALRSLRNRVADLSNDIRRVAYELHPSILDHLGLAVALRSYCNELSKRESLRVQLSTEGAPKSVPEPVALCLYRVAQESLRNVVKHASAKSAKVTLQRADGGIRLTVKDDGSGFDLSGPTLHRGIGLLSMKERMRLVDGRFKLTSHPEQGTRIDAWAPLNEGSYHEKDSTVDRGRSHTGSRRPKKNPGNRI